MRSSVWTTLALLGATQIAACGGSPAGSKKTGQNAADAASVKPSPGTVDAAARSNATIAPDASASRSSPGVDGGTRSDGAMPRDANAGASIRDAGQDASASDDDGGPESIPGCGDGHADVREACDGTDLHGASCTSIGMHFTEGTLRCTATCTLDVSTCKRVVPTQWTCAPERFAGDDGCDCGCGVMDPDCAGPDAARCVTCGAYGSCASSCLDISQSKNWRCVPPEWTCSALQFGDGTHCDCGCGVLDPDCDSGSISACDMCQKCGSGCNQVATNENWHCAPKPAPAEWTCGAEHYGSYDGCDCGCGALDPDCDTTGSLGALAGLASSCTRCNDSGSCATTCSDLPALKNWICIPTAWTCTKSSYADGNICNCGCGALDPDCTSGDKTACGNNGCLEGCGNPLSCAGIADHENWSCVAPAGWTCATSAYSADHKCNCGCGVVDLDCTDNSILSCATCDAPGSCASACQQIKTDDNAHCN